MSDTLTIPPDASIKDYDDPSVGPGDYIRLGTGNVARLSNVWITANIHAVREPRTASATVTVLPPDAPANMFYLDRTLKSERLRTLFEEAKEELKSVVRARDANRT